MENTVQRLSEEYTRFQQEYCAEDEKIGFFQRLFAGSIPALEACISRFFENAEAIIGSSAPEESFSLAEFVLKKGGEASDSQVMGLVFSAVQRPLIAKTGELTPEEAAQLAALHRQLFPKRMHTPVVTEYLKALDKRAKE